MKVEWGTMKQETLMQTTMLFAKDDALLSNGDQASHTRKIIPMSTCLSHDSQWRIMLTMHSYTRQSCTGEAGRGQAPPTGNTVPGGNKQHVVTQPRTRVCGHTLCVK